MSVFDDLLKSIPEEDRAILDKHPELKTTVEKLEGAVTQYGTWYQDNWDKEHGMTKSEYAVRQEASALQAKLDAASAAGIGNENGDFISEARKAGFLSVDDANKLLDQRVQQINQTFENTIAGMDRFYGAAYSLGFKHKDEFGEPLDTRALLKFINEKKIQDPELAYEQMVASKRAEIGNAKHQKELQEAEERGANRVRQEQAMGTSGMLPTDNTGGIVGITHIAPVADLPKEIAERTAGMKLTDPALAQAGLEMARRGLLPTQ